MGRGRGSSDLPQCSPTPSPCSTKRRASIVTLFSKVTDKVTEVTDKVTELTKSKWEMYGESLRSVPFFKGMPDRGLKKFAKKSERITLEPNQKLVRKGDPSDSVFLTEGPMERVEEGKGIKTYTLVDITTLYNSEPHSCTVISKEASSALRIDKVELHKLIREETSIFLGICKALDETLRECNVDHPGISLSCFDYLSDTTQNEENIETDRKSCSDPELTGRRFLPNSCTQDQVESIYTLAEDLLNKTDEQKKFQLQKKFYLLFLTNPTDLNLLCGVKLLFAAAVLKELEEYYKIFKSICDLFLKEENGSESFQLYKRALILHEVLNTQENALEGKSHAIELLSHKVDLLKKCNLFKSASLTDRVQIAAKLEERTYEQGATIFNQNDKGGFAGIVDEGAVKAHQKDLVLKIFTNGELFGDMSLEDESKRSASITAMMKTKVQILFEKAFRDLVAGNNPKPQGFVKEKVERIRAVKSLTQNDQKNKPDLFSEPTKQPKAIIAKDESRKVSKEESLRSADQTKLPVNEFEKLHLGDMDAALKLDEDNILLNLRSSTEIAMGEAKNKLEPAYVKVIGTNSYNDLSVSGVTSNLEKIYQIIYDWTDDTNVLDKIPLFEGVRSLYPDGTPLLESLTINGKNFYDLNQGLSQKPFLYNLVQEIYKAGIEPERELSYCEADTNLIINFSQIGSSSFTPKESSLIEGLKDPILLKLISLIRLCAYSRSWGHADTMIRQISPCHCSHPLRLYPLQGTECHINIANGTDFSVTILKKYGISTRDGYLYNREHPIGATIPYSWTMKSSSSGCKGELRILRFPGIIPGTDLDMYRSIINSTFTSEENKRIS